MCPTAISMNTYVLRIHILTDIVNLCGKSVLTRHPDTGLALGQKCQSGLWSKPSYRVPCRDTRTGQPIKNANIKATGSGRGDPLADDIYVSCDKDGFMSVIMGIGY
ncbi:TPA: hypothetical protein ACTAQ9_000454 [Salmonella enterica subsp. enterica serovar Schwarzengrund]